MSASSTREHACDWVQLGPIIGHTTDQCTRVLVHPFATKPEDAKLELRIAKAAVNVEGFGFDAERGGFGPLGIVGDVRKVPIARRSAFPAAYFGIADSNDKYFDTVLFEIDALEPNTRYFYEAVPSSAPPNFAGAFASRQPLSLRTLPASPTKLDFAFMSCNGLHRPPRGRRPTGMWRRLVTESLADPDLYFALFGGDQIYGDIIREEWLREWDPDFDPAERTGFSKTADEAIERRYQAALAKLPGAYERIYLTFWRRPEIRGFMGHLPCLMTWDDHDIYDGWGSHGNEGLPAQQAFFKAASAAFDAFQFQLAPGVGDPREAASLRGGHRGFSFMVGNVAFIVLDLRSRRDIRSREVSKVLGDKQWAWVCDELEQLARRVLEQQLELEQLIVVSAIPVVHIGGAVEHLLPNSAEMHDDMLDQWSSLPNREERARLLDRLFHLRKQTGVNIVILAGDAHTATIGDIRSNDPRFVRAGEREAVIYQGVSSAIASGSPTGVSANIVRLLVQRDHRIDGSFQGHVSKVVAERNFSIVSCRENGVLRFTLFNEGSKVPEHYDFGANDNRSPDHRSSESKVSVDQNPVVRNALRLVGEVLVLPGSSLLVDGDLKGGAARAVLGLAARAVLGPIGWLAVAADSYSKSVTGRSLLERVSYRKRPRSARWTEK